MADDQVVNDPPKEGVQKAEEPGLFLVSVEWPTGCVTGCDDYPEITAEGTRMTLEQKDAAVLMSQQIPGLQLNVTEV